MGKNIYKEIINNCYDVELNMNDTFCWATAESCTLSGYDITILMPLFEKFDVSEVLIAYAAVKLGYGDVMHEFRLKEYKHLINRKHFESSMKEIKKIQKNNKYFCKKDI